MISVVGNRGRRLFIFLYVLLFNNRDLLYTTNVNNPEKRFKFHNMYFFNQFKCEHLNTKRYFKNKNNSQIPQKNKKQKCTSNTQMGITFLHIIKMKIITLSILLSYVEQLTITQLKEKSHKHIAE